VRGGMQEVVEGKAGSRTVVIEFRATMSRSPAIVHLNTRRQRNYGEGKAEIGSHYC